MSRARPDARWRVVTLARGCGCNGAAPAPGLSGVSGTDLAPDSPQSALAAHENAEIDILPEVDVPAILPAWREARHARVAKAGADGVPMQAEFGRQGGHGHESAVELRHIRFAQCREGRPTSTANPVSD